MFTQENWSYSCFQNSTLKVIISLGGDFQSSSEEVQIQYLATVLNEEQDEMYQYTFNHLDKAIEFVNDRYEGWEFQEVTDKSGDGCGTCEAH